jgi:hypothetical protein
MPDSSSDQERRRLAETYSQKTNIELAALANDGPALTELAREALRAEILRRGLNISVADVAAPPAAPPLLPIIRVYRDLPDALVAQSVLDSAGIDCFLFDENIVRLNWFRSYAVHQIKLRVADEDAADAAVLLDAPRMPAFVVEGVGEYVEPVCPNCQSPDVSFRPLLKRLVYALLYLDLPVPLRRPAWKCHSCGYEWRSGEPGEQPPLNWNLIRLLWIWGLALDFAALLNHYGSLSEWFWYAYSVVAAMCLARFAVHRKFAHAFLVGLVVDGWGFVMSRLYVSPGIDLAYPFVILWSSVAALLLFGSVGGVVLMIFTWFAMFIVPERQHRNEPET